MLSHVLAGLLALTPALIPVPPGAPAAPAAMPAGGMVSAWRVSLAFDGRRLDDVYDLSRVDIPVPVREVRAASGGLADFSDTRGPGSRADTVLAATAIHSARGGAAALEIETGGRAQIFLNGHLVRRMPGAARQTLAVQLEPGRNTLAIALSGSPDDWLAGVRVLTQDMPGW